MNLKSRNSVAPDDEPAADTDATRLAVTPARESGATKWQMSRRLCVLWWVALGGFVGSVAWSLFYVVRTARASDLGLSVGFASMVVFVTLEAKRRSNGAPVFTAPRVLPLVDHLLLACTIACVPVSVFLFGSLIWAGFNTGTFQIMPVEEFARSIATAFVYPVGAIVFLIVRRLLRPGLRRSQGLCPRCAYDLRGSPCGRCPECGSASAIVEPQHFRHSSDD